MGNFWITIQTTVLILLPPRHLLAGSKWIETDFVWKVAITTSNVELVKENSGARSGFFKAIKVRLAFWLDLLHHLLEFSLLLKLIRASEVERARLAKQNHIKEETDADKREIISMLLDLSVLASNELIVELSCTTQVEIYNQVDPKRVQVILSVKWTIFASQSPNWSVK